jgi:hypothetical protein
MKRYLIIAVAGLLLVAIDIVRGAQPLDLAAATWIVPPLVLFGAAETTVWALLRRHQPVLALGAGLIAAVGGAVWCHNSAQPHLAIGGAVLVALGGLISGWDRLHSRRTPGQDEQARVPADSGQSSRRG